MINYPLLITPNLSFREATRSHTADRLGIVNIPDESQYRNIKLWAENIFEPLRAGLGGKPIFCQRIFSCPALNAIIPGASKNSQHMALNGAAGDIDNDNNPDGATNRDIFFYILDNLDFDQLIAEYPVNGNPSWVHVSYKEFGNRNEALYCTRLKGNTKYFVYETGSFHE
jgi:hypothetical protein